MSEMPEQNVSGSFNHYKTLDSPQSEVGNHGGFCTQNDLISAVFEEDYSGCCLKNRLRTSVKTAQSLRVCHSG